MYFWDTCPAKLFWDDSRLWSVSVKNTGLTADQPLRYSKRVVAPHFFFDFQPLIYKVVCSTRVFQASTLLFVNDTPVWRILSGKSQPSLSHRSKFEGASWEQSYSCLNDSNNPFSHLLKFCAAVTDHFRISGSTSISYQYFFGLSLFIRIMIKKVKVPWLINFIQSVTLPGFEPGLSTC